MHVRYTHADTGKPSKNVCCGCSLRRARAGWRMIRSLKTLAKVTLVFLNIWVLAVVLVVSLGHWRVFETNGFSINYDNSHLIVMRELKQDGNPKPVAASHNVSIIQQQATQVPAEVHDHQPVAKTPSQTTKVENVQRWCDQHHPSHHKPEHIPTSKLGSILVDKKHKLLFCAIPGVAMNDWRKILLITNGVVNTTKVSSIVGGDVFGKYGKSVKKLSEFSSKERVEMLTKYYKVMFVRDPLERLVAAYTGKLAPSWSKYFHKAFGTQIIKRYRRNAKPDDIKKGSSVRFDEFGRYIVDVEHEGSASLNEHWQQYYKLCHPCLINYDYIGSYENVEKDTAHVLDKIGAKSLMKSPFISETKRLSEKELIGTYKTMSSKDLNNLFKIYSPDYTLFGYKCPHFLHQLMEKDTEFHDY
ncbi:carbohydrate sulfotransferase 11 [Aplysia californica]|uniref:Carbohydrate sulfotransferase n=1 Tax=Aplysia californica TaxID=6500 RepID=A0ABM1A362_APLCA|nr:carbohydrate sulfotransferase 11 [Aplysia californica]